jgi:hypothetical protein
LQRNLIVAPLVCVGGLGGQPHKTMENKPIEFRKLYNNTERDFTFKFDSANYVIKAGETKDFINYIAEHGARKMADFFAKTTDKQEKAVLAQSFLENVSFDEMAKKMGVNLDKIRKEALAKEKDGVRVQNLESQVADLTKKLNEVLEAKKETKEEVKEEKPKKVYKCDVCGEEFDMAIKLTNHTRSAHKDK